MLITASLLRATDQRFATADARVFVEDEVDACRLQQRLEGDERERRPMVQRR